MNVAFVYRHKITNEVLVVDMDRAKELDRARPYWELLQSINAFETLHFIIGLTPRQRNKYIKQLTRKP